MIIQIFILLAGFIILIKGADIFVDSASSTASNFKISKILIGLTIVAFGTSAPEFAVSIKSISLNSHDIIIGNVIGSNILNILLILGTSSLFHSLSVQKNTIKKEIPITLLLTFLLAILLSDNVFDHSIANNFTRSDGFILFLVFLVFVYYLVSIAIKKNKLDDIEKPKMSLTKSLLFTILGIIMIVLGSDFVVKSSTEIAKLIGVSEKMIGLTIIAIGTSLPELVTSVTATRKGECDLAIGNVIGSNIFNMGIVLGLPVMIFGGTKQINFNYIDMLVMLLSIILLFVFCLKDKKISRKEGIVFLIIFVIYYGYVIISG